MGVVLERIGGVTHTKKAWLAYSFCLRTTVRKNNTRENTVMPPREAEQHSELIRLQQRDQKGQGAGSSRATTYGQGSPRPGNVSTPAPRTPMTTRPLLHKPPAEAAMRLGRAGPARARTAVQCVQDVADGNVENSKGFLVRTGAISRR